MAVVVSDGVTKTLLKQGNGPNVQRGNKITVHCTGILAENNQKFWRFHIHSFLPARRYASAGNSDRNVSVHLSVCPSVCLSRAGIVSKRRKLAA